MCVVEHADRLYSLLFDDTYPDEQEPYFLHSDLMALTILLRRQLNETKWDSYEQRFAGWGLKKHLPDVVNVRLFTFSGPPHTTVLF